MDPDHEHDEVDLDTVQNLPEKKKKKKKARRGGKKRHRGVTGFEG